MKIDRSDSKLKNLSSGSIKEGDKKVNQTAGAKFMNLLDRSQDENYDEYTKKLARDILEQGDKLGKRIDVRDLISYKALIKEFFNRIMTDAPRFVKTSKTDRRGRHKVFVTIKKIDEELELLTLDVLSNQKDNIKILKRIEDIRGMILDIEL